MSTKIYVQDVHGACLKQDTNISSEDIEKGGQKECMSHTMGRSAMKCCLMVRTWLLVSRASVQHRALMYDLSNPIKNQGRATTELELWMCVLAVMLKPSVLKLGGSL